MRLHDTAFYAALFFILGIAAASLSLNIWLFLTLIIILCLTLLTAVSNAKLVFIFACVGFLGFFYYHFYLALQTENIAFDKEIVFQAEVFKEPVHGIKSEEIDVKLQPPYEGEARIYTEPITEFHYGDLIEVKGEIGKSPTGRLNIISFPETKIVSHNNGSPFKSRLFRLKENLISNLNAVLPSQEAALMSGILLGERGEFTQEFKEELNRSGTTHIVALSGYNISIIGITLATILAYFMKRRWAFYVALIAIPLFVIMTGAESSVVRAGIMGIIVLLAQKQSRLYSFRNAVTLTAFAMLLFNPKLLIFDLGFQLSFAALLGIVYFYPKLENKFQIKEKGEGIFGWRKNLWQTFSAQAAVAPILLAKMGYFSVTGLIANVLILEFIPLTMLFGFLTAVLGFVSYELSLITGWLANAVLSYEILVIKFFGAHWF